jgi:hypothetical protein
MLALSVCGAGLAGKYRVKVRTNWAEPTNLYTAVALPPGDRKSAVYAEAVKPVLAYEKKLGEELKPVIAEKESERRVLDGRLKAIEAKAAKATDPGELHDLKEEAKKVARELAAHVVPAAPEVLCDDVTPEKLAKLLAEQGGRMLQASAEGTAFEIVKGRYSESANFDVYLKGHAGDPLRVGRISRASDTIDQPALSVALAVQPDVIRGLAEQASLKGRGFLARFLYAVPDSLVGSRRVKPSPIPHATASTYSANVLALWNTKPGTDQDGKPTPIFLQFSREADEALAEFERWLEPRLGRGQELDHLAGWANKLAGAVARIAGVLHMARSVGPGGVGQDRTVSESTVSDAIRLGRDYLLPHAMAAFGMMGSDQRLEDAKRAVRWLAGFCDSVKSVKGGAVPTVSRRDLHANVWGGSRRVEEVDGIIELLAKYGYIRPAGQQDVHAGRGRKPSPLYEVNPLFLASAGEGDPLSQNSQNHKTAGAGDGGEAA